jgi:flagellar biosynthesis protein FlhG
LVKVVSDQAEGLRRLIARHGARAIAVTGGSAGVGSSSTVVNLAAALAAQGKDVLVVDEYANRGSIAAMFGGPPAQNFGAFMRGEMPLEKAALRHSAGFSVLAAPRAQHASCTREQLRAVFDGSADIVLIDVQLDRDGMLSELALQAHDLVIVTRVAAQAITDAYACMKRLHFSYAIAQFRVLVNHVQSKADAQTALDNLADVASRYLAVALEAAGCIAADPRMARSQQLRMCVVEAFPSTAAARDFRQLAAELQYWPMRPAMSSRAPWPADAAVKAAPHAEQPSAQHI